MHAKGKGGWRCSQFAVFENGPFAAASRTIAWYTDKLGFELVEDTLLSEEKRWVLISSKGSTGCRILLARAANAEQVKSIGNQSGGRVFLFLHTDDFHRDHAAMRAKGVEFVREPATERWGTVAVFEDLYGNRWDLIGP